MSSIPALLENLHYMMNHFGDLAKEQREKESSLEVIYLGFAATQRRWAQDLEALMERDRTLLALEAGGVDNWEGYENAMSTV